MTDPRITDETTQVAMRAWGGARYQLGLGKFEAMRAALEAVLPDLGDILQALTEVYESGAMGGEWPTLGADAVMDLITGTES